MNDKEIEGDWRLCLYSHGKVGVERKLVGVGGRPCLRGWLEGGGEGLRAWTGEAREPRHEESGDHHHACQSGHDQTSHDNSRAGPSRTDAFRERMKLDGDITQEEIWLTRTPSDGPPNQGKKDKGKGKKVEGSSIPSTPEWARKVKAERQQMRSRIQEEEHKRLYAQAVHTSRKNRATLQQALMEIADLNHHLSGEHHGGNQGEADSPTP